MVPRFVCHVMFYHSSTHSYCHALQCERDSCKTMIKLFIDCPVPRSTFILVLEAT